MNDKMPFESEAFRATWAEWEQHRKEIRKKLTPTTVKRQFKKLAEMGEARAIASLLQSIENGWTGIFEPRETPQRERHHGHSKGQSYTGRFIEDDQLGSTGADRGSD